MLTAKATENDKITGLETGADDYIVKPFSIKEVLARVRAVLRRTEDETQGNYADEKLSINYENYQVICCGEEVKLTRKEFALLETLVKNIGRVSTRQNLLDQVWGYSYYGDTRTLDVHIRRLRAKLGECENRIETVVGIGYRFVESKS
jgi:DNA-binding response OmpR family regulator